MLKNQVSRRTSTVLRPSQKALGQGRQLPASLPCGWSASANPRSPLRWAASPAGWPASALRCGGHMLCGAPRPTLVACPGALWLVAHTWRAAPWTNSSCQRSFSQRNVRATRTYWGPDWFCITQIVYCLGFPDGSDSKESTYNEEDWGSIPGSGRSPGKGNSYPLQYFLPGEFHRQRSLARYSPWDHKELDTTEQLT